MHFHLFFPQFVANSFSSFTCLSMHLLMFTHHTSSTLCQLPIQTGHCVGGHHNHKSIAELGKQGVRENLWHLKCTQQGSH